MGAKHLTFSASRSRRGRRVAHPDVVQLKPHLKNTSGHHAAPGWAGLGRAGPPTERRRQAATPHAAARRLRTTQCCQLTTDREKKIEFNNRLLDERQAKTAT